MTDQMRSNLTTAYLMFIFEYADPSSFDKTKILEKLGGPLFDLFDTQRTLDKAKRDFSKQEFSQLLALYFNQFQSSDGFEPDRLAEKLETHKSNFTRHLGKDKLAYLNLIVKLMKGLGERKKRGLLVA